MDDLNNRIEGAVDFMAGAPAVIKSDADELRAQLLPQPRNISEERIAAAKEVSTLNYEKAARSFWLIRSLIARGKEASLVEDHPQNVESLLTFLDNDQGIKSSGYTPEEQEYAVQMFLGYCLQKKQQPFLGAGEIERNDELSAVNKVFQALEIYAADPLKKGHPVDALLEEAQTRGINGENTAKEIYCLKKMGKTLDAFYPNLQGK